MRAHGRYLVPNQTKHPGRSRPASGHWPGSTGAHALPCCCWSLYPLSDPCRLGTNEATTVRMRHGKKPRRACVSVVNISLPHGTVCRA